jgi:hypothetical protein
MIVYGGSSPREGMIEARGDFGSCHESCTVLRRESRVMSLPLLHKLAPVAACSILVSYTIHGTDMSSHSKICTMIIYMCPRKSCLSDPSFHLLTAHLLDDEHVDHHRLVDRNRIRRRRQFRITPRKHLRPSLYSLQNQTIRKPVTRKIRKQVLEEQILHLLSAFHAPSKKHNHSPNPR